MRSEFANSVQIEKLWLTHFAVFMLLYQYLGKQIQTQGSVFVFRQVFTRLNRLVNGKSNKLGYYHEEKAKKWICAKETCLHSLVSHKSKAYWYFVVFIFSDDFELQARLVTPLNFEPITSPAIWKINYSNLCIRFDTWGERRINQLPLQRRKVRQTLPNLMLFAAPNLTCRTKLIQTPLFCRT